MSLEPIGPAADRPVVVTVPTSRCPKCGSTDRTRYSKTVEQAYAGLDRDGHPYTHIVRRTCRCAVCGQSRVDRSLECRGGDCSATA